MPKVVVKKERVVVVEDQRLFADLIISHCQQLGLKVIGSCETCEAAQKLILKLKPELVLLDISLPDGDGLELADKILKALPLTKIIAISAHLDAYTMLQVQRIGLHGFVDKTGQRPELLSSTIQAVLAGKVLYAPIVNESSARIRRDPKAFIKVLSDYETKILAMIGMAKDDKEIGVILGISPSTVQSRRRDIMQKLDIHTTPKLIRYAIQHGLTRAEQFTRTKADPR